jgi:predicted glycoside hydrolase/deacetylase ChbG (UPF0249 family)
MPERSQTLAQLLGYAGDARLLVINADDFGMCHAENVATIAGLEQGAFCSSTIMVPCPWFAEAVAFAQRLPGADLGVHITHTSEWPAFKWGPVAGRGTVPSLVDARGHFYRDLASLYTNASLQDIEIETRAQIEAALAAGIDVTHLDSHMGTLQLDVNYHDLYIRLAAEYRLPIRMADRAFLHATGMQQIAALADTLGVLSPDHFWYGGPPAPQETAAYWTTVLQQLTPGVSELYIHAAADHPEMRALGDSWAQRAADFAFFTAPSTAALIRDLGIRLIGYRPIRELQRRLQTC